MGKRAFRMGRGNVWVAPRLASESLLFSRDINDLEERIISKLLKFSDDIKCGGGGKRQQIQRSRAG